MEVAIQEPTQIVDRKQTPRTLSILPPCFDESNRVEKEYQILDGVPYIEHFNEMQIANAEKTVRDEMRNMDKRRDYLQNDPMPECKIIDSKEFEEQIERIYRKENLLDFAKYECLGPSNDQSDDLSVWKNEVDQCKVTYAHQLNGLLNLELMKKFNAAQWSEYNKYLRQLCEENNKLEQALQ